MQRIECTYAGVGISRAAISGMRGGCPSARFFVILLLGWLLFMLCGRTVVAQQHVVEVRVVDAESGLGVEFAAVQWKPAGQAVFREGCYADSKGRATIRTSSPVLVLQVGNMGYTRATDTLRLPLARPHTIRLQPATTELGKVEVMGKSRAQAMRESPEAISVLSAQELQGRTVSVQQVLNKTMGLKVGQGGGVGSSSRIIVHGLEGNRVQLLWDGIPLGEQEGLFSLDEIPIDIIERIEVYKGIIPARFGCDGLGGAVNIVTKEFSTDYLDASYELGSYAMHKASLFTRKNLPKHGVLVGAGGYLTYAQNNYRFRVPEREYLRVRRDHDRFHAWMLKGKVALTRMWFDEASIEFGYYTRYRQVQGIEQNVQHAENNSGVYMLENRLIKGGLIHGDLDLESHFSLAYGANRFTDTSRTRYDFEGRAYPSPNGRGETGDVPRNSDDLNLEINERLNFDYRLSSSNTLNLNTLLNHARRKPNDTLASRHVGFAIGGFPSLRTSLVAGLTWEARLFGGRLINMLSGKYFLLRTDIEDLTSYELIAPPARKRNTTTRLGWIEAMKYEIAGGTYLKGSYQRAIRLPNAQELFGDGIITFPAAGLKPELSHNFNVGLLIDRDYLLRFRRTQLEVGAFYMRVGDMIKLVRQHMVAGYVNAERVNIKGVEAELKLDINSWLYAYGNITYQDARDALPQVPGSTAPNPTYGLRLPNIPYLFSNFGVECHTYDLPARWYVKLFYDGRFTQEYFYNWELTRRSKRRIPQSWVHDVGLLITYHGRYSLALECHNVMGREVWDQYRRPLPGRTFHVKFRYTFAKGIL